MSSLVDRSAFLDVSGILGRPGGHRVEAMVTATLLISMMINIWRMKPQDFAKIEHGIM